jgi:hypothetical protein
MSIEYVDFQFNNLSNRHILALKYIIKQQFEIKEDMRWRLGLRTDKKVNITALGIKSLNLANNKFGDDLGIELAD